MNNRKLISNKKLLGGGLIVVVAGGILSMFGVLFPGLGGGSGEGDGDGNVQISTETDNSNVDTTPSAQALEVDGILDIIIDETSYLIQKNDDTMVVLSLDEIAERAPEISGNAQGVKVRISRKRSSLLSAERKLEEVLKSAGLSNDQILWVSVPID